MFSEIHDLTLPAHDANSPKPRGRLPVRPEVDETLAERRQGIRIGTP